MIEYLIKSFDFRYFLDLEFYLNRKNKKINLEFLYFIFILFNFFLVI